MAITPTEAITVTTEATAIIARKEQSLCCKNKDRIYFQTLLENLDLSHLQKQIVQSRYISILENFQKRANKYSVVFFMGHFIITVGSLFVPALLSIQNSSASTLIGANFSAQMYWATFIVSLLVTIFNGILTLFKIDKKFYFLTTTLERLRTEGWQYFGLTGRYSHSGSTHANQFIYFTHQIEKIKMKQVEEEYYKSDEKISQPQQVKANELLPLSPDQPIHTMKNDVPEPVQEAVNMLIKSQTERPMSIISLNETRLNETPSHIIPLNEIMLGIDKPL